MRVIDKFLPFLFRSKSRFYPFERQILDVVIAQIGNQSDLFNRQINALNHIQRLADGKEINLYQIRNDETAFDDNLRLSRRAGGILVGHRHLKMASQSEKPASRSVDGERATFLDGV